MQQPFLPQQPTLPPEPQRGKMFGGMAGATVLIGVAIAVFIILRFRTPEPLPPEIKEVEKVVERVVEKEVPAASNGGENAALKPSGIFMPQPPTVNPAPQPFVAAPPILPEAQDWGGVWHQQRYPLPSFRMVPTANGVRGLCASNWSTDSLRFESSDLDRGTLRIIVDDGVFRLRFLMTKTGDNSAKVEAWLTDEDWSDCLIRANRKVRTVQEAILARAILENNFKHFRTRKTIGTFIRQSNDTGD
jgi:hypothetical protein